MPGPPVTRLPPNRPHHIYRANGLLDALRGPAPAGNFPEDWIGSATALTGRGREGLTVVGGTTLAEMFSADPEDWFGAGHSGATTEDPGLLVKLLAPGQRLPVHYHPDRAFARAHLDCCYGKTEAWIVLDAEVDAGTVHIGWTSDVSAEQVSSWVQDQDVGAMLANMHALPVAVGDTVLVPAGLPHAIGPGLLILEVQEPTDFSIFLEWTSFLPDADRATLGLGHEQVLECLDRAGWSTSRIGSLRTRLPLAESGRTQRDCFVPGAAPFFQADFLAPRGDRLVVPARFGIVVVWRGSGSMTTKEGAVLELRPGECFAIPYVRGPWEIAGDVEAIVCHPAGR